MDTMETLPMTDSMEGLEFDPKLVLHYFRANVKIQN